MKKIIKIWKTRKLIWEGIKNYLVRHPAIENVAMDRLAICMKCDIIDYDGGTCMVPGTAPCCGSCGCKLALKVRSLASECPHPTGPRWKAEMTQEEQDAHYEKIKYNPDKD